MIPFLRSRFSLLLRINGQPSSITTAAMAALPRQTSNTPFHSRSTSTATKAFSTISKLIESAKPVEVPRIRYAVYCISWPTDQPIPEITHPIITGTVASGLANR